MIPTRIGQKFEGGYFSGVIRIRDCAYAILVAPKSTEHKRLRWKTQRSSTSSTQLVNNGWSNTNAMNDSEHPAAQYCRSLTVGGHTDLYLPSCNELELCYRNLKPTDRVNDTLLANGANRSSIPTGAAYTEANPACTIVTAFQTGNAEAFDTSNYYWTSTEFSANTTCSLIQTFSYGTQNWNYKTNGRRVRGIRRVLILLNDEKHNDTN